MMKSKGILALVAVMGMQAGAKEADVKPALAKDGFDEEQMRLAQVIHKRIVDYQQIKKQTNNGKEEGLEAYKETLKTGAQFEMLPVKGGSFTWKGEEEGDVLEVELSPFWMGKAEVTWEEYEPFMLTEIPRQKDGQVLDFMREQIKNDIDLLARPTPPYHPMTYGMARDGHPAVSMTQHAANKYCQWLSYQTGHFYRLPTEAEWEYVCRAGSKGKYSWGDDDAKAGEYAWVAGDGSSQYQKPGLKKPNAWGFLDMHGNVLEWTLDQYVANRKAYFGKDKVVNPWVKATQPYPHVTKGGHWKQTLKEIEAGARYKSDPMWKISDPQDPKSLWYHTNTPWLGMRVVRPKEIPSAEEMYHYWNSGVEEDE
ncbi:formylglycine-generating enzyme family protein [Rubritalea tangerina]|uniref:Formylglycine-generating enzyme family protein n=2 Tax=Rubritalea tangerina TaxID=430798 RepID=A0ABW4ZE16_9BACT